MTTNELALDLLRRFDPSESALSDWLGPKIDDSMLEEISVADWGIEAAETLAALKSLRSGEPLPDPLPANCFEVLSLTRWIEPDNPDYKYCRKGIQGHLIRAFCCTLLLKAADAPYTYAVISSEVDTLVHLIESSLLLGREATESALRLLCWRILRLPYTDTAYPFFATAALLLSASLHAPTNDEADLSLLTEWVMAELAREDAGLPYIGIKTEIWWRLGKTVLQDPVKSFSEFTSAGMQLIVSALAFR